MTKAKTSRTSKNNKVAPDFSHIVAPNWSATQGITKPLDSEVKSFQDLPLSEAVLEAIAAVGYETPTPVQATCIPLVQGGFDLIIQSRTGTGKTAAFAIPTLERISPEPNGVEVLVLAPTRELAKQVAGEYERLTANQNIQIASVYGGTRFGKQIKEVNKAQIVCATPGRLLDLLQRKALTLDTLKFFVLDEADEMLSMGFEEELNAIVDFLPEERQSLLFSATVEDDIKSLASHVLTHPELISFSSDGVVAKAIDHVYYLVGNLTRLRALARIIEIEKPTQAIVFTNTREETFLITNFLKRHQYSAEALNSDLNQREREETLSKLRDGEVAFLVATDVAARGIDVSDLSHVINARLPESHEVYIHRTGRTGRAGKKGVAINLIAPTEIGLFYTLQRTFKVDFTERELDIPKTLPIFDAVEPKEAPEEEAQPTETSRPPRRGRGRGRDRNQEHDRSAPDTKPAPQAVEPKEEPAPTPAPTPAPVEEPQDNADRKDRKGRKDRKDRKDRKGRKGRLSIPIDALVDAITSATPKPEGLWLDSAGAILARSDAKQLVARLLSTQSIPLPDPEPKSKGKPRRNKPSDPIELAQSDLALNESLDEIFDGEDDEEFGQALEDKIDAEIDAEIQARIGAELEADIAADEQPNAEDAPANPRTQRRKRSKRQDAPEAQTSTRRKTRGRPAPPKEEPQPAAETQPAADAPQEDTPAQEAQPESSRKTRRSRRSRSKAPADAAIPKAKVETTPDPQPEPAPARKTRRTRRPSKEAAEKAAQAAETTTQPKEQPKPTPKPKAKRTTKPKEPAQEAKTTKSTKKAPKKPSKSTKSTKSTKSAKAPASFARIHINLGKNKFESEQQVLDLVTNLTELTAKDCGEATLRSRWSYVEVPEDRAEDIIQVLNGQVALGVTLKTSIARPKKRS